MARSSRAWFEYVRQCSVDAERVRQTIERMEAREQPHAQSYQPSVSHGGNADAMQATDARILYEDGQKDKQKERYAALDRANAILYGEPGKVGLDKRLDSKHADVVCFYYCMADTWDEVARSVGYTESHCRRMATEAFAWMDENGMAV